MSDSVTPWTIALQAPVPVGSSRQEYYSALPFPSPGGLPNPEIKPMFLVSPALAGVFFTPEPPGNPFSLCSYLNKSLSICLKLHILSSSHYQHFSFQISWKNNPHWFYLFVVSTSQSTVAWLRLLTTSYMLNQMDALQDVSPMTFLQHLALLLLRSSSMSSVCAFPLASETAAFAHSSCSACFVLFCFF